MDRFIIILSSVLFVATWTVVIVLFIQESKTTYVAQDHFISEEISLSDKSFDSLWALHSHQLQLVQKETNSSNELVADGASFNAKQLKEEFQSIDDSSLDSWREYFTDEEDQKTISINELLNIFGQTNEAVSES
ncbi:hypothetical protein ACKXGF_10385 [Alkalibacillus sp. S2W]|uniref:hypothetical protein n=1 Tax=Alkalibacillus sp. S2W TaxID=3386553 RepID=UPI00398D57CE